MPALITFDHLTPVQSIISCALLAILYVCSLYVWKNSTDRDDPRVIKKRFISVLIVSILSPIYVWWWSTPAKDAEGYTIGVWLGLRIDNIILATILPLLLTTAPFTEEFVYRACMLPILFSQFGFTMAILICPLMFGLAHLHHLIERIIRKDSSLSNAIAITVFQCGFTTVFGWYTSFVFLRTGHIIGPIVCHAFCNSMGFPTFSDIDYCRYPKLIWTAYIVGLVMFVILLFPLTNPDYYQSLYRNIANNK
ncbi:CAAX prenyl protease 2 [Trichoplax sp. H2]|nr:CAAX prenyl protease 2 [Trichoplax sp. H2]|eukprot:RDD44266.1 CAAX prenyl protease 2 [Trichoplax sp. H2]